jgi:hypothetical protein
VDIVTFGGCSWLERADRIVSLAYGRGMLGMYVQQSIISYRIERMRIEWVSSYLNRYVPMSKKEGDESAWRGRPTSWSC